MLKRVGHILKKGPQVILFRGYQAIVLNVLRTTGYWGHLQKMTGQFWTEKNVMNWAMNKDGDERLITANTLRTFKAWADNSENWKRRMSSLSLDTQEGKVTLFDHVFFINWQEPPWNKDWRYGYEWQGQYFGKYKFYLTQKAVPYDVKYPWELSRFGYLIPIVLTAALTEDKEPMEWIRDLFEKWETDNPVAYSVNWHSMECSIRVILLSMIAQIVAAQNNPNIDLLKVILRQLALNSEFVYKTIEYTDVRGNHFAANIVALLVAGQLLHRQYRPARRWLKTAKKHFVLEIGLQFCSDGVNFEKAIGYHRLATELFFLGMLVSDKLGNILTPKVKELLGNAFYYMFCYTQPDGLAPHFGDNDCATILNLDGVTSGDHRPLLSLGATYFADKGLKINNGPTSAGIPLLIGSSEVTTSNYLAGRLLNERPSCYFPSGGMFVSSWAGNFLITDYGEVGQRGLGGHGHNDLFSFELWLAGNPIIVDSGCPIYTGNIETYDRYRGTACHNGLMVDGEEIARFEGPWRIRNEAKPYNVISEINSESDCIEGEHAGYERLNDPVKHGRKLLFDKLKGRLSCEDRISCRHNHQIERFLHFSPTTSVKLESNTAVVSIGGSVVAFISWNSETSGTLARVEATKVSSRYGHEEKSTKLILTDKIINANVLCFQIESL